VRGFLRNLARHRWSILVVIGFALSRLIYARAVGVEFESKTLIEYQQFIDPELLRTDLVRSLYYLRDQPPLFNLFLGVVLKVFPVSFPRAFQVAFVALGLSGALASRALAKRLGAGGPASTAIALAVFCLPCTVLYENWLFYGYPIAMAWIFAGLATHRTLERPTVLNAFLAIGAVANIALMRGTIHPVVLVGAIGALVFVRRHAARRILMGAAFPFLLVVALYVKHAAVFGGVVIGQFFRGTNLAQMQTQQLTAAELHAFQDKGIASRACPTWFTAYVDLDRLLANGKLIPPLPTGIPELDRGWKSTGTTNWNSTRAEFVGRACLDTGKSLREAEPHLYWHTVARNVTRFFMPADRTWPFLHEGEGNNADRLRRLNRIADAASIRVGPGRVSLAVIVAVILAYLIPLVAVLGVRRSRTKLRSRRRITSSMLTSLFGAGVFLYSGLVVLFASVGDHNRYRAEVMPLLWVVVLAQVVYGARVWYRRRRLSKARTRVGRAMAQASSVAGLLLLTLNSGCGSQCPEPKEAASKTPWPSTCVIDVPLGNNECESNLAIGASADGAEPIAVVARRDLAHVVWRALPDRRAKPVAHVDVAGEGLHISGWAPIDKERFELKAQIDVVPGSIWIPAGGRVSVLGLRNDRVVVSAPPGLESPERVEGETDCGAFGQPHASSKAIVGPPFAAATAKHLALRAGARGDVVLEMKPKDGALFVWLEEKDGRVHLRGGPPPWAPVLSDEAFVFDGWVVASEVRRVEKLPETEDRDDGGCGILDTEDACPISRFKKGAALFVGREAEKQIGSIDADAPIDLGERRGEYIAVRTHNQVLRPPAGELFWARLEDVDPSCSGSDDNGCPCGDGGAGTP